MTSIPVTRSIALDADELRWSYTRASGPGGQHVNTTDSAVLLRFDVEASPSLPEAVKRRLAVLAGSRLGRDGVLTLRAESSRSQEMNRREARERLVALVAEATIVPKKRRPTRPTLASKARRVEGKKERASVKAGRGRVRID